MAVAVVDADGAIVQVGPQSLRYLILQTVMLHQPSAQLLVGGHARNDLVASQAGRFDMGGDLKHIVQTLLRLLEFIRRHRQFQLFKYPAAGYIQL